MGGDEGDGDVKTFRLKVHGAVKKPFEVDYAALLKLPQVEKEADVHCVTGWSLLGGLWKGVQIATLAENAGVKGDAQLRHLRGRARLHRERAAQGGDRRHRAWSPTGSTASRSRSSTARRCAASCPISTSGRARSGSPASSSCKDDEPGYWEIRGYNNHADPWKEERYG